MTDLVKLRNEIKSGIFSVFVKRGKIYIEDTENGECIMLAEMEEVNNG